jgi:undecaprenyl-diphosphatase
MTFFQALALGIIQGLTEFLPVSSSGHLVLFQNLFGLIHPELAFDIAVHLGTLAAVLVFFRKDIIAITVAVFTWIFSSRFRQNKAGTSTEIHLAAMIAAGSVPTAIIGFGFHEIADLLFSSVLLVGFMLLATGFWMWFTRYKKGQGRGILGIKTWHALLIGICQGIAIIPGISRSGATIASAMYLGIDKPTAARFSFLLSIPAIAGAALLNFSKVQVSGSADIPVIIAGAASAGIVGYGALWLLVFLVEKGRLAAFAPYCWAVGLIVLAFTW